ncbi:MAG: YihA family ribosome biogenesis GTP-binding protein [Clostridiales bacterium]|nr:YihA family ribosome biogenesis GTP-binding protein [Clostridiales bacterium]
MEIKNSKFVISATSKKQYPEKKLPEIVLIGKSNIGKSSFINCLCNRNKLAKTSSVPGKTRLINFYNIDDIMYFVDLPGYGYSKMSKSQETEVANYINDYLSSSGNISLILFLVDIRHKPTQLDQIMFNWLIQNKKQFIIIANKADKIAKTKANDYISVISSTFKLREYGLEENIPIIPFSSISKLGKEELLDIIEKAINS